jgi:hypothetical protein
MIGLEVPEALSGTSCFSHQEIECAEPHSGALHGALQKRNAVPKSHD